MLNLIVAIMNRFGYIGIAILIAIENLFPPIPSEVILTFSGFLTTHTQLTIWGVTVFSTIGSVVGAIILYYIGKLLNRNNLYKLVNGKLGHLLHFKIDNIEKSEKWFLEKGKYSVFFCRFIPIIRSLISIPAGMSDMDFSFFMIFTILGSAIWNIILVSLGAFAGESWQNILLYFKEYSNIIYIILGILFILFIIYKKLFKKKIAIIKVSKK